MLKRILSSGQVETMSKSDANAIALQGEIEWFTKVVETRLSLHFGQESAHGDIREHEPPDLRNDESEYARLVNECGMKFEERIVLVLALIPHIRPEALDPFFVNNKNLDRGFAEFGGLKGKVHGGFLPTCETASFILNGNDLARRFSFIKMLEDGPVFVEKGIVGIEHQASGEPMFSGVLKLSNEYLNLFTTGHDLKPDYSMNFPAKRVTTKLKWEDLVLGYEVLEEVENINAWLKHAKTIMEDWGLEKTVKPGYRCLFYGPPGTGKTLTATLIGANAGLDVYRIDLSMVVSKYIGETEKNLANIFDQGANKNWILFFDEADALFGKRTQASSSNDRYANQEVSYLLQRVEDFPGVVILATNLKANMDEAFSRRFQSSIYFPLPDAEQRLRLFRGYFKGKCLLEPGVDLEKIAEEFVLSGGAIANVVRYGAIRALHMGREAISHDDLVKGIAKELIKEGKTI